MNAITNIEAAVSDDALIADLRDRGVVGPIDPAFLADYRRDREFAAAIRQMDVIPGALDKLNRALIRAGILPSAIIGDEALIAAWERVKSAEREMEANGPDASEEQDAPANAKWDAADEVVFMAPATTIQGAIVKLRRSLLLSLPYRWSTDAIIHDDDTTLFARAEEFPHCQQLAIDALAALQIALPQASGRSDAFGDALAEFKRLRARELALPRYDTIEEEEAMKDRDEAMSAETTAAFDVMIVIPVTDTRHAAAKLAAIADFYDLGACGLDRSVLAQVHGEINAALGGGGLGCAA